MPSPPAEITFRCEAVVPPTRFPAPPRIAMPVEFWAACPAVSSPSQLPATVFPSPPSSWIALPKPVIEKPRILLAPAEISKPIALPSPVPFASCTSGPAPLKPVCVCALIASGCTIFGSGVRSVIVYGAAPGIAKRIESAASVAFAARIAARRESGPESFVFRTTNVAALAGPAVVSAAAIRAARAARRSVMRILLRCREAGRELGRAAVVQIGLGRRHRLTRSEGRDGEDGGRRRVRVDGLAREERPALARTGRVAARADEDLDPEDGNVRAEADGDLRLRARRDDRVDVGRRDGVVPVPDEPDAEPGVREDRVPLDRVAV